MKRKDLLTGEEFIPKRITQKFANGDNRKKYYNNKANRERHENNILDQLLKTNKRVLDILMEGYTERVIDMLTLERKGFSFNVINHIEIIGNKQYWGVYKFLYSINHESQTIKIFIDDRYKKMLPS